MDETIIPRRSRKELPAVETEANVDSSSSSEESSESSVATKEVLELVNIAKEGTDLVQTEAGHLLGKLEEQAEHITKVIVTVPNRFRLTLDNHTTITIEPGVQKIEQFIANHWFSKANGVKIFEG